VIRHVLSASQEFVHIPDQCSASLHCSLSIPTSLSAWTGMKYVVLGTMFPLISQLGVVISSWPRYLRRIYKAIETGLVFYAELRLVDIDLLDSYYRNSQLKSTQLSAQEVTHWLTCFHIDSTHCYHRTPPSLLYLSPQGLTAHHPR